MPILGRMGKKMTTCTLLILTGPTSTLASSRHHDPETFLAKNVKGLGRSGNKKKSSEEKGKRARMLRMTLGKKQRCMNRKESGE